MENKVCTTCKKSKPLEFFAKNKLKKCGYNSWCKPCQKIYHDKHYRDNKADYIAKAHKVTVKSREWLRSLRNKPCFDCGGIFPPECMDFDHTGKDKEFNVGDAVRLGISKQRILEEINKCELVCANCHRILTYNKIHAPII